MEDDGGFTRPPIRLMSFVSQEELERSKKARGERVEDGTAQRDRPLFEILKENKDKKDLEFNERFKHRPPKALDEDEMEFLDNWEMSRKEHERKVANEEEEELQRFRRAVEEAQQSARVVTESPAPPKIEEPKAIQKKSQPARPLGGIVILAKQPSQKKPKTEVKVNPVVEKSISGSSLGALVSYGDESEEE
ncbi:NEFA-interacting nuclear protein [Wolffia australiana]